VVREGVPPLLSQACVDAEMPLFEVPYRTPFIAVARANAEAVAAESYARRTWALSAQRAVALAALRPDGLTATLAELARQLDAWVGLFDAAGTLRREHPAGDLSPEAFADVEAEVAVVLRRGARAGSSLRIGQTPFTLQTLGRGGHLRGVVAIAAGELDAESRAVVTSVIAMAGLALEQNDDVLRARGMLRAAVVQMLLADNLPLARRLARELGAALPSAATTVAVASGTAGALERAAEWLDPRADLVLFGRGPEGLVLIVADDESPLFDELADRFGVRVGVARPSAPTEFSRAHSEAVAALRRADADGAGVRRFGEAARAGVLGALDGDLAKLLAAASLASLIEHDQAHGSDLLATLRAWLDHDARIDVAATALGVHRHTVRARIALAERLLDTDLSTFAARAQLWTALQVADV
jgi:purine catabolism regulator